MRRPPLGLRAHQRAIPTENQMGVQLDWPPIPPGVIRSLFTTEQFVIHEIFVIRSTDPRMRQRFSWLQNFDLEPDPDSTEIEELVSTDGKTQVVARLKNDGFIAGHIDRVPLSEKTEYYYAIALRYSIGNVPQPMGNLSNVERVYYNARAMTTRKSEPPDWFASPTLVQLFPAVYSLLAEAELFIARFLVRTTTNSGIVDLLKQLIVQIQIIITHLEVVRKQLARIENILRTLSNQKTLKLVHSTTINVKQGGIFGWANELAFRLSNPRDGSRPKYLNNELTTGFILVAGAPRYPELKAVRSLFQMFFGDEEPDQENPLRTALRSFEDILRPTAPTIQKPRTQGQAGERLETPVFDSGLKRIGTATTPRDAVTAAKENIAFNAELKPSDRADDC
jgi:hypothetical protein